MLRDFPISKPTLNWATCKLVCIYYVFIVSEPVWSSRREGAVVVPVPVQLWALWISRSLYTKHLSLSNKNINDPPSRVACKNDWVTDWKVFCIWKCYINVSVPLVSFFKAGANGRYFIQKKEHSFLLFSFYIHCKTWAGSPWQAQITSF